jgi:hypothetical protein
MFEPITVQNFDSNYHASQEQVSAAHKMLDCVSLHDGSWVRDGDDKRTNNAAMKLDRQSSQNAAQIKKVDAELLREISSGNISPQVKADALKLHMQSRALNDNDAKGDIAAQRKDALDVKAEQEVINADTSLLRSNKLSTNLRHCLQADVQAKVQLQQNEKQDIPAEQAFLAADARDQKLNEVIIKALSGTSKNWSSSLRADMASKAGIISTRQDDLKAEPGYSKADNQDQLLNDQLNAALSRDPYLAAATKAYMKEDEAEHGSHDVKLNQ